MDSMSLLKMVATFSAVIPIAIGSMGAALGMSKIGMAALEGIARQPEMAGRTFTTMLIAMALIEALAIYCLLISLILLFGNPYIPHV
ncbi:MAG: ATP synthase F0 subunit C [bacterium]